LWRKQHHNQIERISGDFRLTHHCLSRIVFIDYLSCGVRVVRQRGKAMDRILDPGKR
jgi:hypothetical protein